MHCIDDIKTLLLNDVPLIDTRAPIEFAKGSFPNAINLPLMSDHERELVGKCYKSDGQAAAIALGHELVEGETKRRRVDAWLAFIADNPGATLFCFRGGLRSQISQQWLAECGVEIPRITGGYKHMRIWLMEQLTRCIDELDFLVIGGPTGAAKTHLITAGCEGRPLPGSIDLEGLANHRGSAFGRLPGGQPSQISFEMALTIALLRTEDSRAGRIIVEDEGRLIGRCALPDELYRVIKRAPLMLLDAPFESRVAHSHQNYILANLAELNRSHEDPNEAFNAFADGLRDALHRIRKRLGGARYQSLAEILESALDTHRTTGDSSEHRLWISVLLKDYYDPMYEYQLRDRQPLVKAKGSAKELSSLLCRGG